MKLKIILLLFTILSITTLQAQINLNSKSFLSNDTIENFIPKYSISVGIGFGYIINKRADDMDKDLYNKLRKGADWNAAFYRYYKNGLGWGLLYQDFRSSAKINIKGQGSITDVNRLPYVAPQFSGTKFFTDKWMMHYEFGIGWLGFRETTEIQGYKIKVSSNTVGTNFGAGIGYRLNPKTVIDFNISAVSGTFNSMRLSGDTHILNIQDTQMDSENRGAGRINVGLSFRYFR